jgi:hypothetical protein
MYLKFHYQCSQTMQGQLLNSDSPISKNNALSAFKNFWRVAKRLPFGERAGSGSGRQVSDSKTDKDPTPPPRGNPGQQKVRTFWLSGQVTPSGRRARFLARFIARSRIKTGTCSGRMCGPKGARATGCIRQSYGSLTAGRPGVNTTHRYTSDDTAKRWWPRRPLCVAS